MSTTETESAANTLAPSKKTRAVLRLEAIRLKRIALEQKHLEAEAAVAAEKRTAEIAQGQRDFLDFLTQKEPDEIDGYVSMVFPAGAPPEKVESVQRMIASLKAIASARQPAKPASKPDTLAKIPAVLGDQPVAAKPASKPDGSADVSDVPNIQADGEHASEPVRNSEDHSADNLSNDAQDEPSAEHDHPLPLNAQNAAANLLKPDC